jgi:hypothetical protein
MGETKGVTQRTDRARDAPGIDPGKHRGFQERACDDEMTLKRLAVERKPKKNELHSVVDSRILNRL